MPERIPEEMLVWYKCCRLHLVMPAAAIAACGKCGHVPTPRENTVYEDES